MHLEARINALAGFADEAWIDEIRSTWGQLEVIYALGLDEGRKDLSFAERDSIDDAVLSLRLMLTEY